MRSIKKILTCLVLCLAFLIPAMGTGCSGITQGLSDTTQVNQEKRAEEVTSECDLCGSSVKHYPSDKVTRPTLCTDDGQDICIWAVVR